MKRIALVSALGIGTLGCAGLPGTSFRGQSDQSGKTVTTRSIYKPPVDAGQINGDNAKDKAHALDEELDRDLQAAIDARDKQK